MSAGSIFKTKNGTEYYSVNVLGYNEHEISRFAEYADGIFRILRRANLAGGFTVDGAQNVLSTSIDPITGSYTKSASARILWRPNTGEGSVLYRRPVIFQKSESDNVDNLSRICCLATSINSYLGSGGPQFRVEKNGMFADLCSSALLAVDGHFIPPLYEEIRIAILGIDNLLDLV